MRVVFIGASQFGLRCLQLLNDLECCQVVGVVTAPQTFSISYRPEGVTNVLYADIPSYCQQHGTEAKTIKQGMKEPIAPDDTIATLYARIEQSGLPLLARYVPDMASGKLQLVRQDNSIRRIMPQRSPEDGRINWHQKAIDVERFIRAQTRPYSEAFSSLEGEPLTIWAARSFRQDSAGELGRVTRQSKRFLDGCGDDARDLLEACFGGRD